MDCPFIFAQRCEARRYKFHDKVREFSWSFVGGFQTGSLRAFFVKSFGGTSEVKDGVLLLWWKVKALSHGEFGLEFGELLIGQGPTLCSWRRRNPFLSVKEVLTVIPKLLFAQKNTS